MSMGRPTGSKGVKRWVYRVPRDQGVGLESPGGSRGRPTRSQWARGKADKVLGGQWVGL